MLDCITINLLLESQRKEAGGKEAFRCPIPAKLFVSKELLG